jgi:predicted transcriptional regulator
LQDSENSNAARKRRGPPPFKPTLKQRKDVTLYAAGGMSEPGIAAELGICQNTLRKHFSEELDAGHERELAANLRRLRKAADKGNVTAMKHLDAKFGLLALDREFKKKPKTASTEPKETKAPKLGKKEIAKIEASMPPEDPDWADLLPGRQPN